MPFSEDIDSAVPGLRIELDYLTEEHEARLIHIFRHELDWPERKGRLALHYGHTFCYKTMGIDPDVPYIPFPDWLKDILPRTESRIPDQVCLQYYSPGTGIPPHVDTHSIYDQLYALSLGAPVIMDFRKGSEDGKIEVEVDLTPRSMLQMTGESRLTWQHGIRKRKRDIVNDRERMREDRWSITYRWLRKEECECRDLLLCDTAQRRQGVEKQYRWKSTGESSDTT